MMKTLQTKIGKNRKSNDKEIEKSKIENEIKHLYEEKRIPKKKVFQPWNFESESV